MDAIGGRPALAASAWKPPFENSFKLVINVKAINYSAQYVVNIAPEGKQQIQREGALVRFLTCAQFSSMRNAFLFADKSCSCPISFSIISPESCNRCSPCGSLNMLIMARMAFRRTKGWRCSTLRRMEGINGSMSSASCRRHKNLNVTPRMYSLGCCKLLRRFWQIRIISGRIFPCASVLSMISR